MSTPEIVFASVNLALNILLVIIAYLVFKNFDVKKQYHNKQLEVVSQLCTDISSTMVSNMIIKTVPTPDGRLPQVHTGYHFSFYEIALGFDYSQLDMICVKSNNIENTFPFLKYRNHPLLPKKIGEALNKLYQPLQYSFSIQPEDLPQNYVALYSRDIAPNPDDHSRNWIYEYYKSPTEFHTHCKELRTQILEWYKAYGAEDLNM